MFRPLHYTAYLENCIVEEVGILNEQFIKQTIQIQSDNLIACILKWSHEFLLYTKTETSRV